MNKLWYLFLLFVIPLEAITRRGNNRNLIILAMSDQRSQLHIPCIRNKSHRKQKLEEFSWESTFVDSLANQYYDDFSKNGDLIFNRNVVVQEVQQKLEETGVHLGKKNFERLERRISKKIIYRMSEPHRDAIKKYNS